MKPTTLIVLGAAGVAGFLIWRHFASSASAAPPPNRSPLLPLHPGQIVNTELGNAGRVMSGSRLA